MWNNDSIKVTIDSESKIACETKDKSKQNNENYKKESQCYEDRIVTKELNKVTNDQYEKENQKRSVLKRSKKRENQFNTKKKSL